MSVREEAAQLLLNGLSPVEVANQMNKDIIEIKRYLLTQVGEGQLRLSDILFSIPESQRVKFEALLSKHPTTDYWGIPRAARQWKSMEQGELRIYLACRNSERGDMYVYIADIEILFHRKIRENLVSEFGDSEDGWWRQGISLQTRKACVCRREEDLSPCEDPFDYTDFIDLREILNKNWSVFTRSLPKAIAGDKQKLLKDLLTLNDLRNAVMHPIKQVVIGRDDFIFVQAFRKSIDPSSWRI